MMLNFTLEDISKEQLSHGALEYFHLQESTLHKTTMYFRGGHVSCPPVGADTLDF